MSDENTDDELRRALLTHVNDLEMDLGSVDFEIERLARDRKAIAGKLSRANAEYEKRFGKAPPVHSTERHIVVASERYQEMEEDFYRGSRGRKGE